MVTIQPQTVSKDKTVKQIVLTNNLLQSSYFSKSEFEKYKKLELFTVKTSYEAGLLIAELIAKLRFRKKFYSKRCRARLKCILCNSKKQLTRYFNVDYSKQKVMCNDCALKQEEYEAEQQEIAESNSERLQKELNPVDEKQEASADLHRKYDYPGGDVDMKIDADKAGQDYQEEMEK